MPKPEPGVLVWQTSSGRTCTINPTEYPVQRELRHRS
jgi:hypothetical protein